MKTITISYQRFEELAHRLRDDILASGRRYDGIVCPLRGGYYLSHVIARGLGLPVTYVRISSYVGTSRGEMTHGQLPDLAPGTYLICDDIYDSGNTIGTIRALYPAAHFDAACLVTKNAAADIRSGMTVDTDVWVVFFWERGRIEQ